MSVLHFVQYHNAVPIALGFLFLGAGGVFAATNPDVLYSETQEVLSVDNTYVVNTDFSSYSPTIQILTVTEDDASYYVSYRLSTIDVVDAVWRDTTKDIVLKVDRGVLGEYGDLGLYVTEQLNQVVARELAYLNEVQQLERRQVSQKVVATAYSGLIGGFLDSSTETVPGYVPVVTPPIELPQPAETQPQPSSTAGAASGLSPSPSQNAPQGSLSIQLLGENPVQVSLGSEYRELGVVVSGGEHTLKVFVNDIEKTVGQVVLDTAFAREWRVKYLASQGEKIVSVERLVRIFDPSTVNTVPPSVEESQQISVDTPTLEASNSDVPQEVPPEPSVTEEVSGELETSPASSTPPVE